MKIAVSYDIESQNVFDHFGHAPAFKIYDVQDNKVVDSTVIETSGQGHNYMVNLMKENNVEVVVAGWMGGHAVVGLKENGILAFVGAEGNADLALATYLQGGYQPADENAECGHHGNDQAPQEPQILYEGKNAGKTVHAHYRGTLDDGTQFDSSYDRGEPLVFTSAIGQMIPGFDKAVVDMEVGQEVDIHLEPEEAYGQPNPDMVFTLEIAQLPGSENLEVGQKAMLQNQFGQPFQVLVTAKDDKNITLDANHDLAGKALNFHIELVKVED